MIKHILVPTDGSEQARCGVEYAVSMAKRLDAVIHGLHVVDVKLLEGPFLRDISTSLGQEPYANNQGKIAMILEERGKAALEIVEQACEKVGVAFEKEEITGLVPRTILERSDLCDIIVMGRSGEHTQWLEGLLGSTTEAVARRAERPVIVTGVSEAQFGHLVVAYDGSHHAHGALKTAVTLANEWGSSLDIVTVGEERAQAILKEARSYIEPHKIKADYHVETGDTAEAIITFAKEHKADVLVLGTYSHSIVRDMLIGSTTAYVLTHAPCPLLLAP